MKYILIILVFCLMIACNNDSKTEAVITSDSNTKSVEQSEQKGEEKPLKSADYSTLFSNFNCGVNIEELAKVLEIPETDLSLPEYSAPNKCSFNIKGFGKNSAGGLSYLSWGTSLSSKKQNKSEINNYLKNREEHATYPKVYQYMSIALSKTKDCYIAQQPAHGRVIIYNENYDTALVLHYGRRAAFKRTKEQHEELKTKMTDLANYLLKKHRK